MEIRYAKAAVKAINRLDKDTRKRIQEGIIGLTQTPPQGDIQPIRGYRDGRYRLRVGGYRIIYRYGLEGQIEILYIMDVGPRGDIYK